MNGIERKVTKVADELIFYLLRAGANGLKVDMRREQDRFVIVIDSDYGPEQQQAMRSLERMLLDANRDRSIEEEYWELMGMNGSGYDPELQLVGMLIDRANIVLEPETVHIRLERFI